MNKEMKKYMTSRAYNVVIWALIVAVACVSILTRLLGDEYMVYFSLAACLGVIVYCAIKQNKTRKFFKEIENHKNYQLVLSDFRRAYSMCNDNVRFGELLIYTKGAPRILSYQNIKLVYQYVHRTNLIENGRSLKYVDDKGQQGVLCELKLRGKSDEDLEEMIRFILKKNPNVKVGYQ